MARGRGRGSQLWLLSVIGACGVIALLVANRPAHTSSVAVRAPATTQTTAAPRAKTAAKPAATTPTTRRPTSVAVQNTTPPTSTTATLPEVPTRRFKPRPATTVTVAATPATTPATIAPTLIVGHLPVTE